MALDVMLDLERLRATQDGLTASIAEFDQAGSINNDLESAIGRPDDRDSLQRKASAFESAWDSKRKKLAENLANIQEQLTAIVDGWESWDTETAQKFAGSTPTQTIHANRIQ